MTGSIRNNTGGHLTRLESVQQSLKRLTQDARNTFQKEQGGERQTSVDVFAYGFGLRSLSVCDFFSLMEVGKDIISEDEIEQIKRSYIQRMQNKYGGIKDIVRHYAGSGLSNDVESPIERLLRSRAEAEIRGEIMLKVKERLVKGRRLEQQLNAVGDTTLPIEEVATLLSLGGEALTNAEAFGDNTPMCEALTKITQRFERELAARSKDTVPVLFLLSDGESTDCRDPRLMVEALKARGVTVVSCFITDQDVAHPRTLLGKADSQWRGEAQLMFDMASSVQTDSHYAKFLLKKGWTIDPEAKLFVQLNHSEVLEEFIQVIVNPREERTAQDSLHHASPPTSADSLGAFPPPEATPVFQDSLHDGGSGKFGTSRGSSGACLFTQGAFYVSSSVYDSWCDGSFALPQNLAIQVTMTFIQGPGGGIAIGQSISSSTSPEDIKAFLNPNGSFELVQGNTQLVTNTTPLIKRGIHATNVIAIVARSHRIDLYINDQYIDHAMANFASPQTVKLFVTTVENHSEAISTGSQSAVAFKDLTIWKL